jgi:hypothetical protein
MPISPSVIGGILGGLGQGIQNSQVINERRRIELENQKRRQQAQQLQLKQFEMAQKEAERKQKAAEQLREGLLSLSGGDQSELPPGAGIDASPPSASALGPDPRLLALSQSAQASGATGLASRLLDRGLGASPQERIGIRRQQIQLGLNIAQQKRAERQQQLQEQQFAFAQRKFGAESELRNAKTQTEKARAQKISQEVDFQIRDDLVRTGLAQTLQTQATNATTPQEANRLAGAAQLAALGKDTQAVKLAYGDRPANAQLLELANVISDPSATPADKKRARETASTYKSFQKQNSQYIELPDGTIIATNPQADQVLQRKLVQPAIGQIASTASAIDQIHEARDIVRNNPVAGGLGGRAAVAFGGLVDSLSTLVSPDSEMGRKRIEQLKEGLLGDTVSLDFYKMALSTILAVEFNGGAGRLTDEDFARGQKALKAFNINGPAAFEQALDTIELRMRKQYERNRRIVGGYIDLNEGFNLPPLPENLRTPAGAAVTPPPSGVTDAPPPLPAGLDINTITVEDIDKITDPKVLDELERQLGLR